MIKRLESTLEYQIATLKSLLRGEQTAVDIYEKAINELADETDGAELVHIQMEHVFAVQALRRSICELGGVPGNLTGTWGALARSMESTAPLPDGNTAIRELITGEKSGASSYVDALSRELPASCVALIQSRLLPSTRDHIAILEDRLMRS